jgi:hypothetical protein
MRLPSKKIFLIFIACAITTTGLYLISKTKNRTIVKEESNTIESTPEIIVNENIKNTSTIDTDGDGLFDWEEVLWGTDPLKKDTNGNGIDDFKEVETKKLQNQEKVVKVIEQKNTTAQPENLTVTDTLAREFFAQYINHKQTGIPMTPEYTQKIVDNFLQKATKKQNLAKFSSRNLKNIIENDTKEDVYNYGNNFWNIMLENTPKNIVMRNEYEILLTAIASSKEDELKKLDPIVFGYENTIKALLDMPVPRSAVEKHLDIINNANSILATIEDMRVYFTDPVRGLNAIVYYKDMVPGLKQSLEKLAAYLKEKNVEYLENEGGYSLIRSI